jgi:hypothetical protein
MNGECDWRWKLREAIERIRTRYDHIGRKSGAPFLAIVYPPEVEQAVLREWRTLTGTLAPEFDVRTVDVLEVTSDVVGRFGVEALVEAIKDPMPGSDPEAELGTMWTCAVAARVREAALKQGAGRAIVVLEHLAALYPASGPRAVMQALWEGDHTTLEGPVVLLIPGVLVEARVYHFVRDAAKEEFMYRGDIL